MFKPQRQFITGNEENDKVTIVRRPGYFGRKRPEIVESLNQQYGNQWAECWQIPIDIETFTFGAGEANADDVWANNPTISLILPFYEAVTLYDEAYYEFLKNNPYIVKHITSYAECYDSDKSNTLSGTEHDELASPRHIQDVSIRRALLKLGTYFQKFRGQAATYKDDELLHIRGPQTNGGYLNPGLVPFHKTNLIIGHKHIGYLPWCMPWWISKNSIEHFWQSNKVIVVPNTAV